MLENQLWSIKIFNINCLTMIYGDYLCFMLTLQCYYWGSNEQMTIWLYSYVTLNLIQWLTISCTRVLQYHTWENFGVPPIVKLVNLASTHSLFTNILASSWFTCQYSIPTIIFHVGYTEFKSYHNISLGYHHEFAIPWYCNSMYLLNW